MRASNAACIVAHFACYVLAASHKDPVSPSTADESVMLQLQKSRLAARLAAEPVAGAVVHRPCAALDAPDPTPEEAAQRKSLRDLCRRDPSLWEASVMPEYKANYDRLYDEHGWVDEAFITYFALIEGVKWDFLEVTKTLIDSVHNFTSKPLIVANIGNASLPESWTAERFPRLVVFNLKPWPSRDMNFNMNKLRAMILAQVRTGVQVDSDTVVLSNCDRLFRRTREEVNAEYPYPMMPVHWMSRDDDPQFFNSTPYNYWSFFCKGCPKRSQRWVQAHPTWTFHALPFVGELLSGFFDNPPHVLGLPSEYSKVAGEDEDKFNVALWLSNATKQWCKFETPPVKDLVHLPRPYERRFRGDLSFWDPKWYPHGTPVTFDMWHGEKEIWKFGTVLSDRAANPQGDTLPAGYFNGTFYETIEDMAAALGPHPEKGPAGVGCYL